MIDEAEIQKFKSYLPQYLITYCGITNLKDKFHCLNPNHPDNDPSMSYYNKRQICHCFSCGTNYDIYDLIELNYNIKNFREKHNKIAEIFNEMDKIVCVPTIIEDNYIVKDFRKYYKYCFKNIYLTNYLEEVRKIDKKLIYKYNIGYDKDRHLIIFPINDNCYFGRSTISKDKYKTKGLSYLFNENLLKNSTENTIIYITESIIDSLSLETIAPNINTISLNGNNIYRFIELVKEYDYKGIFIIATDNDYRGKLAGKRIKEELKEINIESFINNLISTIDCGKYKDINEALINNSKSLIKCVSYFDEQYHLILDNIISKKGGNYEIE